MDLKTLQELDADDDALVKYKATLLGETSDVLGELCSSVMPRNKTEQVQWTLANLNTFSPNLYSYLCIFEVR